MTKARVVMVIGASVLVESTRTEAMLSEEPTSQGHSLSLRALTRRQVVLSILPWMDPRCNIAFDTYIDPLRLKVCSIPSQLESSEGSRNPRGFWRRHR